MVSSSSQGFFGQVACVCFLLSVVSVLSLSSLPFSIIAHFFTECFYLRGGGCGSFPAGARQSPGRHEGVHMEGQHGDAATDLGRIASGEADGLAHVRKISPK